MPARAASRWHGHAYLLYQSAPRPLQGDGVLLVGDAAGLAYAPSGEGIRTAIESGLLAADVLLEAVWQTDLPLLTTPEFNYGVPLAIIGLTVLAAVLISTFGGRRIPE